MIIRTLNVFQGWLGYILCYSKGKNWATSSLRSFANAPFHDNQQSSAFHPAILDILILALTMCSVLSAWDLKIHCCIDLFSRGRCRCALWDCNFRFVGLAVSEMKYFGMCHTHFYDKNAIHHKMGK